MISVKTSSSYSSARGGIFCRALLRFAVPAMRISFLEAYFLMIFCLRFGCPAMKINILEEMLFLGWFLGFVLLRLEGHGESVLEV